MLQAVKKVQGLTPTKTLNKQEPNISKSLNFSYNYLQEKVNIDRFKYDTIKPIINTLDNITEGSLLSILKDFGSIEQTDISRISSTITNINRNSTYQEIKLKYKCIIDKESKIMYFGQRSNPHELIKSIYQDCGINLNKNFTNIDSLNQLKQNLIRDTADVELYKNLVLLFINEIQNNSMMTDSSLQNTPLPSRLIQLNASMLVSNQLLGTIDILLNSLNEEQELFKNFLNILYPSFITLLSNNKEEFNKKVIEFIKS